MSTYDALGRRISREHPDGGLTTYDYDLAGNLTSLTTANLKQGSGPIVYEYEYERLTDILYPDNSENDVHYVYGEAGAAHNRAGRIVMQEDASGAQEFFYGPLGEVVKNVRTVVKHLIKQVLQYIKVLLILIIRKIIIFLRILSEILLRGQL